VADIGNGCRFLNFVWYRTRCRVPCGAHSYLVMCYDDRVLGHLRGVCPIHTCLTLYFVVFDVCLFIPYLIYLLATREKKWQRVKTRFTQLQQFTQKYKLLRTWSMYHTRITNFWRRWGLVTHEQCCYFAISFPMWNFLVIRLHTKGQGLPTAQTISEGQIPVVKYGHYVKFSHSI
jgi:hypothetical protein